MSAVTDWREQLAFAQIGGLRTRYWRTGLTTDPVAAGSAGAGEAGRTPPTVVVLHGWGAKIESMHPVVTSLQSVADVIALDMPGFGESELPPATWGTPDYAGWLLAALDHFELERPSLVGHSFGGKVSICHAASHSNRINRLLLIDSAGIKPRRGADYYAKVYSAKFVKHTAPHLGPLGERMRARIAARVASSDYANAGPLRPTMARVVNEQMTTYLARIHAPTLLIWGEDDTATPVSDGKQMEQLIPDSALIVFEHAGHFSYLDEPGRFRAIAQNFLAAPAPAGASAASSARGSR